MPAGRPVCQRQRHDLRLGGLAALRRWNQHRRRHGSICYGERHGAVARSGGWGELFSDEGSAYWIACRGLNVFSRMSDGRAVRGPLYEIVRQSVGIAEDLDLCAHVFTGLGGDRARIAKLCQWVTQAARAGDAAALDIVRQAAAELALMVDATGNIWDSPPPSRWRFRTRAAFSTTSVRCYWIPLPSRCRRTGPGTGSASRCCRRPSAPRCMRRSATAGPCRMRRSSACGHKATHGDESLHLEGHGTHEGRPLLRCLVVGWLALGTACSSTARAFAAEDFASMDKIDVHVHINTPDSALIDQAGADHFRLLTINVDYPDFPPIAEQARIARELVARNPSVLAYAATFSMNGWDEVNWQPRVIQELEAAFAGAPSR